MHGIVLGIGYTPVALFDRAIERLLDVGNLQQKVANASVSLMDSDSLAIVCC